MKNNRDIKRSLLKKKKKRAKWPRSRNGQTQPLTKQRSVNSRSHLFASCRVIFIKATTNNLVQGLSAIKEIVFFFFFRVSTSLLHHEFWRDNNSSGWWMENLTCSQNITTFILPSFVQFHDDSRVIFSKAGEDLWTSNDGR